ncbi:PREDICTED: homogentisate phytyltransferase 1, chloroplastic-like [Lupinus angustifolius]|uniref:homogentisate phytyltransferase 1, chloroplastic-like n=1 Tax=Lupinus angustifolius TaxID=3871 RepID=UPI00092E8DB0|nr:PREDICTED: homogentisate phytyltransferase 1, chloroplastic-like [Lupinus angustifolius]
MDSVFVESFPKSSSFTIGSYAPIASLHKRKIQKEHNILRFQQLSLDHLSKGIKGGSTCQGYNRKYVVKADSEQPFESESQALYPKSIWDSVKNSLDTFYRFSRPHTIIGTALSIISVSLLAVEKVSDFSPLFFTGVLKAVVAALFMNIYIVGLNQLSDVEIDKINKPYLPLASGEYSFQTGVIIVASFSILSFWLGWIVGSWPLFWALFISFVLGTAYSINVSSHVEMEEISSACSDLHYGCSSSSSSTCIFPSHIYVYIPDIEGDKIFGIQSFSVSLGQKKVFWICVSLLEIAYGFALLMGAASPCLWSKIVTVLGHAVLALVLWYRAISVDFKSKASITSFYMFIWKLFYAEYFLIPLVR